MSRKTEINLKTQLEQESSIIAPYVYDCLTARMAENTGFKTFVLSASSVAMTYAMPDLSLLSVEDMIQASARVADYLPYPLITEFKNGFSQTPYGVYHNVKRLLNSGICGVMIDDTSGDKEGEVVSEEVFYAKIVAAKEAVKGGDCMVIAVTAAKEACGLDACIQRLQTCIALGADAVMCRGLKLAEDCEKLGTAVEGIKLLDAFADDDAAGAMQIKDAAAFGYSIALVRYIEKASLYGLMQFGMRTKRDNTTVYTDYHDYDGKLPSMDHHILLSNQWRELEMEIKKDLSILEHTGK